MAKFGTVIDSASGAVIFFIVAVLIMIVVTLLRSAMKQNEQKEQGGVKIQEIKARRVDVGVSLGLTDESEIPLPPDEKVAFSRTVKVLLVEDNQINMEVAQYMLKEEGIVVHVARDGKEAVDMFTMLPPHEIDVILMDVMMPVMDGIEATRVIRGLDKENSKTIPIIALTASQSEDDIRRTKEAGMNEYLRKPFDIDITLETIRKYIK